MVIDTLAWVHFLRYCCIKLTWQCIIWQSSFFIAIERQLFLYIKSFEVSILFYVWVLSARALLAFLSDMTCTKLQNGDVLCFEKCFTTIISLLVLWFGLEIRIWFLNKVIFSSKFCRCNGNELIIFVAGPSIWRRNN